MLQQYLPIAMLGALATLLGLIVLGVTFLLGPRDPRPAKTAPYESGVVPIGPARRRVPVRFYLTATLFILFDVEIAFLFPWAVTFRTLAAPPPTGVGSAAVAGMALFLGLLTVGLVHAWRSGALDWNA